jgi:hypothetical protein
VVCQIKCKRHNIKELKYNLTLLVIFLLILVTTSVSCKKDERIFTGKYNFMIIENYTTMAGPHYSYRDTTEFQGSVRHYKGDTLKIKFLEDNTVYGLVDEEGSFYYSALNGTLWAAYGVSGGFLNTDEVQFHFYQGGLGGGTNYTVCGYRH